MASKSPEKNGEEQQIEASSEFLPYHIKATPTDQNFGRWVSSLRKCNQVISLAAAKFDKLVECLLLSNRRIRLNKSNQSGILKEFFKPTDLKIQAVKRIDNRALIWLVAIMRKDRLIKTNFEPISTHSGARQIFTEFPLEIQQVLRKINIPIGSPSSFDFNGFLDKPVYSIYDIMKTESKSVDQKPTIYLDQIVDWCFANKINPVESEGYAKLSDLIYRRIISQQAVEGAVKVYRGKLLQKRIKRYRAIYGGFPVAIHLWGGTSVGKSTSINGRDGYGFFDKEEVHETKPTPKSDWVVTSDYSGQLAILINEFSFTKIADTIEEGVQHYKTLARGEGELNIKKGKPTQMLSPYLFFTASKNLTSMLRFVSPKNSDPSQNPNQNIDWKKHRKREERSQIATRTLEIFADLYQVAPTRNEEEGEVCYFDFNQAVEQILGIKITDPLELHRKILNFIKNTMVAINSQAGNVHFQAEKRFQEHLAQIKGFLKAYDPRTNGSRADYIKKVVWPKTNHKLLASFGYQSDPGFVFKETGKTTRFTIPTETKKTLNDLEPTDTTDLVVESEIPKTQTYLDQEPVPF